MDAPRAGRGAAVSTRRGALASALPLSGCAADPARWLGVTPAPPPPEPAPEVAPSRAPRLSRLGQAREELVVAGERLDADLLRRFQARRGFAPVWKERPEAADALASAVLKAGEHGLDPELLHAALLRRRAELSPEERELALSAAALAYANALAHGAVPVGRRGPGEELSPEPLDVAEALDAALRRGGGGAAASLESLAPQTPGYAALRRAQARNPTGDAARARALAVNLERQRWLPRALLADLISVNVADQTLVLLRGGQPVFVARAVVGDEAERNQTPEFQTRVEGTFFNPPWIVPKDIAEARFLPRIQEDPGVLARSNMVLRPDGDLEQRAGPNSALGAFMLDMPYCFDVYVHDTPGRHASEQNARRLSAGCIRVEQPRSLVSWLLDWPLEAVERKIAAGDTARVALPEPVPILVAYQTAFADEAGEVRFRPDFYGRDARLWRALRKTPPPQATPAAAVAPTPAPTTAPTPAPTPAPTRAPAPARPQPSRRARPR